MIKFTVILAISWTMLAWGRTQCPMQSQPNDRLFSVQDSIEMRVFSDPYTRDPEATAKEAPDGRGFIAVTTQGHLASNTLQSCLWYFSRKALDAFLNGKSEAPRPVLLYRRQGKIEGEQINSYGSLISDVRWSSDASSITFLVEVSEGQHHLYRLQIDTRKASDLTSGEKGNVIAPSSQAGTTTYLMSVPKKIHTHHNDAVARVITGHGILQAIFPKEFPEAPGLGAAWKLKVHSRWGSRTFPSDSGIFFPYTAAQIFTPSIAPNGSTVLTVIPVHDVPSSWMAYRPDNALFGFRPSNTNSDRSGRQDTWPWQYALIDLITGKTTPLFSAPAAYTTGSGGVFEGVWSYSGERLIVTNTYLPLSSDAHEAASIVPCAIAEYELKDHRVSCLAKAPPSERGQTLVAAEYEGSDNIVAKWTIRGLRVNEVYSHRLQRWDPTNVKSPSAGAMALFIKQDMDVPPALWVKRGAQAKMLWEPNPQLHCLLLGKASLYQWNDSSGYLWRGGLVLPRGPRPDAGFPLVIQTHGFYNPHEFLVDGAYTSGTAAQPLASAGIAVLQMEDRAGRHQRPPEHEADDEAVGIESAIDHLAGEHIVDASKVGIQGFSRTSWYVEKGLERSPDRYKAALIIDGVDQSYVSDVLFAPGSTFKTNEVNGSIGAAPFGPGLRQWMENAAGFNLDKIKTPVRLEAHGTTFSILGEWEIYSILQQQGKPVDFIDIVRGQHILQMPMERYVSQQGAVDWFRFWLQHHERSHPEDTTQYVRWSGMRSPSSD